MAGILLYLLGALWLAVAGVFAWLVTRVLPAGWWRFVIGVLLCLALLPMPLIDEIVGKKQFEQLCRENSMIQVDLTKAAGRTVYLADLPDVEIKDTWVRVVLKPWRFVDAGTGEVVVSYNTLMASGGKFVHALPLSEGRVPLSFAGSCAPANRPASKQAFANLGINYIERPANKGRSR